MAASMGLIKRDIVTPVTTVLFVVSTVSGIMLLLHWQGGLVRAAHEWPSLVFAAFAGWHLVKNWRSFVPYLRRNVAIAALALSLAFTAMTGTTDASGVSPRVVLKALSAASLETAAPLFDLSPAAAIERLDDAGFAGAAPGNTLAAIAHEAGRPAMDVIAVLAATAP